MGSGRAHGEGAHQDADREPATGLKPRRDDFHGGRVGARHTQAGGEAEHEGRRQALDPERERPVERRPCDGAPEHEYARRHDVGEIAECRAQRPQDEARLDGDRESGAPAVAQVPFAGERGQHGGGAEPEGQRAQLGQGEEEERPPPSAGGFSHLLGQRVAARLETRVVGALGLIQMLVVEI